MQNLHVQVVQVGCNSSTVMDVKYKEDNLSDRFMACAHDLLVLTCASISVQSLSSLRAQLVECANNSNHEPFFVSNYKVSAMLA